MHGDRSDFIVVGRVVLDEQVRAHVPHLHRTVRAARRQALTLRVKCHCVHHAAQLINTIPGKLAFMIQTLRNGKKQDLNDLLGVVVESVQCLVRRHVPELHQLIV